MPSIQIPKVLSNLAAGQTRIELDARTPNELVLALKSSHPALYDALVADNGALRPFITLVVDGEVIVNPLTIWNRPLAKDSAVRLLSAIAGG